MRHDMPTIAQLPAAATVGSNDELPISQSGILNSVTVSELLASAQPQLTLPTGALLGRVSLGAGGPEPVEVGVGLRVITGSIEANGTDHVGFPLHTDLAKGDTVVINSGGAPALIPAGVLQGLPPVLPLAAATSPGAVLPGDGMAVSTDGMLNVVYGTAAGTATVGNDSRVLGALQSANNLSELTNPAAARLKTPLIFRLHRTSV
jgi:hypothetical protein